MTGIARLYGKPNSAMRRAAQFPECYKVSPGLPYLFGMPDNGVFRDSTNVVWHAKFYPLPYSRRGGGRGVYS